MNSRHVEMVILLILVIFGVVCTQDAPDPVISFQTDYLGNFGYALLICGLLITVSIISLVGMLRGKEATGPSERISFNWSVLAGVGVCFAYVVGVSVLGFMVSTFIFTVIFPLVYLRSFIAKNILSAVCFAAIVTGITYAAFKLFKIYTPDALFF